MSLYSPWVTGRDGHIPSESLVIVQPGINDLLLERLYEGILLGYLDRHWTPDFRTFVEDSAIPVNR